MQSGKYGSGIHLPNWGTIDDNIISLGNHDNDCLGNVMLCPKGVTMSIWFKAPTQAHVWPWILNSPAFRLFVEILSDGRLKPTFGLDGTLYDYQGEPLTLNEWHLIVYTYKDLGFNVYIDGCKLPIYFRKILAAQQGIYEIGCKLYANCMTLTVDDFRFWGEQKDDHFIWWLWSQ